MSAPASFTYGAPVAVGRASVATRAAVTVIYIACLTAAAQANAKSPVPRHPPGTVHSMLQIGDSVRVNSNMPLALGSENLTITRDRLDALMVDEDYDDDFLAPSAEAYGFALRLLNYLEVTGLDVPRATPAPVGDGGIFIQWGTRTRYVRLLIPTDPNHSYVYQRDGAHRETVLPVTEEALTKALEWLTEK